MIDAQLNYFDMAVIGIMLLSCLFAFFRGFVKEILSLLAWVGSGIITIYFFKDTAEALQPHFTKAVTAAITATSGLYFGSLLGFAIFNRIVLKILKSGSEIGWFDNILGLVFGALRGAFVISLGFAMIAIAVPKENYPEWLEQAKTRPYAEKGATILASIAPAYLEELASLQKKAGERVRSSVVEDSEQYSKGSFERVLNDLGKGEQQ